jgi:hypothetical protein
MEADGVKVLKKYFWTYQEALKFNILANRDYNFARGFVWV